jgi:hypothetical protein
MHKTLSAQQDLAGFSFLAFSLCFSWWGFLFLFLWCCIWLDFDSNDIKVTTFLLGKGASLAVLLLSVCALLVVFVFRVFSSCLCLFFFK